MARPSCSVVGCPEPSHGRGLCNIHYRRLLANGNPSDAALRRALNGTGWKYKGYQFVSHNGEQKQVHVLIAETVLGRRLKRGEQIHHVNEIPDDNRHSNLVICPTHAYHALLHVRTRALKACGNADWRSCQFCKTYDDQKHLVKRISGYHHPNCAATYERERQRRNRTKLLASEEFFQ